MDISLLLLLLSSIFIIWIVSIFVKFVFSDGEKTNEEKPTKKKKIFKKYSVLPPELKMMIIYEMECRDRCRFTRCSKLSYKQAKESKNYMHGLRIEAKSNMYTTNIYVIHGTVGNTNEGYVLVFKEEPNNHMICTNMRQEELWRDELDDSENVPRYALKNFKNLLKTYQNQIKKLHIRVPSVNFRSTRFVFAIHSFRSLEELETDNENVCKQLLPKLSKPLKILSLIGLGDPILGGTKIPEKCEAIYRVQKKFSAFEMKFNNEQFIKFSAAVVLIPIGYLTERDIFNFIQSWKNDTIGKEMECYKFSLHGSNFNVTLFFSLLGIDYDGSDRKTIEIKHEKRGGTNVKLQYDPRDNVITFVDIELLKKSFPGHPHN